MEKQETKEKQGNVFWPTITDRSSAEDAFNTAIGGIYIVCLLQGVIGTIFLGWTILIEVCLVSLFSYWTSKSRFMWQAIVIFLWALSVATSTLISRVTKDGGGTNIFLMALIFCASITIVRSLWYLRGAEQEPLPEEDKTKKASRVSF